MKSHLIIQGPMHSFFTPYCHPYEGPEIVTVNGQPAFDSSANVLRIAREYRQRFDTIVLSTWENEPIRCLAELESLGVIIQLCPLASIQHVRSKWRQVVGMVGGLKPLADCSSEDRITKTRTDIWFDVPGFVEHAERVDREFDSWRKVNQLGFIHAGNSRGPFYLEDMFHTARAADFHQFWNAAAPDQQRLRPVSVHMALPIEYAWQNREKIGAPKQWFWDYYRWWAPWHTSQRLLEGPLWRHLMTHCFCLAPEIEEENFIWRGRPSNHCTNRNRLKRYQFHEQWRLARENEHAQTCLTDLSYFNERRARTVRGWARGTRNALSVGGAIARG